MIVALLMLSFGRKISMKAKELRRDILFQRKSRDTIKSGLGWVYDWNRCFYFQLSKCIRQKVKFIITALSVSKLLLWSELPTTDWIPWQGFISTLPWATAFYIQSKPLISKNFLNDKKDEGYILLNGQKDA